MTKAKATRGSERRDEALSHDRIIDAAIALLDQAGANGLTFRALASRLSTGPGAIYWHVANKDEILVAATDAVVALAMNEVLAVSVTAPRKAIRTIAIGVFDAVDAHPWVGAQLSRAPWETATLQIFERLGRHVKALGGSPRAQFTSASKLLNYIIGVSVQNAAQGRALDPPVDRAEYLGSVADRWKTLDANEYPFSRSVASHLRDHDDRAEFLAGIDLILAGIAPSR